MTKSTTQKPSERLASASGINRRTAETFIKAFAETIVECARQDGAAKVSGLGTFKIQAVADRESVKISTGERFIIPGYNKLTFTAAPSVSDVLTDQPPLLPIPEAPAEESPAEESPAEESLSDESPSDESPSDESPALEVPVEVPLPEALVEAPVDSDLKTTTEHPASPVESSEPPAPAAPTVAFPVETSEPPAPAAPTVAAPVESVPGNSVAGNSLPQATPQPKPRTSIWAVIAIAALAIIVIVAVISSNKDKSKPDATQQPATQQTFTLDDESDQDANQRPRVHILRKGESLTTISVNYYGTPDSMAAIWKLNKFPNPNDIPLGTEILLP
ncbi:MAG: HU family DNA-binding protein [Bacteroidaceae bacterium]|nr:HU family DNA-binding protein [Bacteroidaceae bacterium]MBQ9176665.1 HU family DNA-binding protein [Bacteroidaceae bacterium]